MYYRSRAIILKSITYRDTDKLVSLFTEEKGKVRAIARGVQKPKSSLRACTQPFCHSMLHLSTGRELDIITQGKLIDFYGNSREDMVLSLHSLYVMELLDKALLDKMSMPDLYSTTLSVLEHLDKKGFNPLVLRYYELQLLVGLGYGPVLDVCCGCGRKDVKMPVFNLVHGGMLCESCLDASEQDVYLNGESLAVLRLLASGGLKTLDRLKASPAALKQVEHILELNLQYHLERKFNLKKTIQLISRKQEK